MKKYLIIINKILIGHTNLKIYRAAVTCVLYVPGSHGWLRIESSMPNAKWISVNIYSCRFVHDNDWLFKILIQYTCNIPEITVDSHKESKWELLN